LFAIIVLKHYKKTHLFFISRRLWLDAKAIELVQEKDYG
jgi:hypothetical protein